MFDDFLKFFLTIFYTNQFFYNQNSLSFFLFKKPAFYYKTDKITLFLKDDPDWHH